MFKKIKCLTAFALLSLAVGVPAQAATISSTAISRNLAINGPTLNLSGTFNVIETNDWLLNVLPAGSDTVAKLLKVYNLPVDPEVTFQLFECMGACTNAAGDVWTAVPQVDPTSLVATLFGAKEYFVRIYGETGQAYNVTVSAVPLPAAALLFRSGLAGFGLLGRRGKKESTSPLTA